MTQVGTITFPEFSGARCLMMPFVQGDPDSVPDEYASYRDIIASIFLQQGEIGFLTIDESPVAKGKPHRGDGSKSERALHTEAGLRPGTGKFAWGWAKSPLVTLDRDTQVLIANNLDGSCAIWDAVHTNTSYNGDIGDQAHLYPYEDAIFMGAGEVHVMGILTPHESMPVDEDFNRQFFRIVGVGVYGREPYFTDNPLLPV